MISKFVIIPAVVITVSILTVFVYDSVNLDKICAESGGVRHDDVCLVEIPETKQSELISDSLEPVSFDNITIMKLNTAELFYYPASPKDQDPYRLFMLIRLPEWMGGAANDTSAFRAYSTMALDDPCFIKYWPDEGRQRIENPCQGGMYRVIDGALTYGATHRSNAMNALPYLDLSLDEYGTLYVEPPKWTLSENGVIGYGRSISLDELRSNSEFLVESFAKYYPKYPPIPTEFAGYVLAEIYPDKYFTTVKYLDFPNKHGSIEMTIGTQSNGIVYSNFAKPHFEYWQIGNTILRIGGTAMDANSDTPESFRNYIVDFSDGYNYKITGKNLEFIKKEIIANFFPEFSYDDLFLVSSTVEK